MKKFVFSVESFVATSLALLAFCLSFALSTSAFGSGNDARCQVAYTTSVKGETVRVPACNWASGSVVLMQCTSDVYFSATGGGPNNQVPDAGATDFKATYTANTDPVPVFLLSNQKDIAVIAVSASGTCTFGPYTRRF